MTRAADGQGRYLATLFGLSGRRALVTGSTRGIGAAIAQGYAMAGAEIIVHGTCPETARKRAGQIAAAGGTAHGLAADLSEPGAGRRLIESCEDRFGALDILVINASAQINADLDATTSADLQFQFDVNIGATLEMLRACLPAMARRNWGRVINIGSVNQAHPKAVVTAYAATKAAQHNLIQSQARAYGTTNVRLNTLAPGLIATDRNKDRRDADPQGFAAYAASLNWTGRAGDPSEMVGAALFLASESCSFMTGECIFLTGGI